MPRQSPSLTLALILLNGILAHAGERRLSLPSTPADYSSVQLPTHVQAVAQQFDNTPDNNPITDFGATLGRVLFYDRSLSANGKVSCASCHRQELAFTDGQRFSLGFDGQRVTRNSMSLINLRYHPRGRFFWDERAATLENQVLLPIENEVEMGHSLPGVVRQLSDDPLYPSLFEAAFGTPQVSQGRIARALAQFLRSIVSFDSLYDRQRVQVNSVYDPFPGFTDEENLGKLMFLGRGGCAVCHLMQQDTEARLRAVEYIVERESQPVDERLRQRQSAFFLVESPVVNGVDGKFEGTDPGVGGVTAERKRLGAFKVSSLRNITLTGPYMHDGRFTTIDRVLEHYNWSVRPHPNLDPRLKQIADHGLALPEKEKVALTAFLRTLTDHGLLKDPRFSDPFVRSSVGTSD